MGLTPGRTPLLEQGTPRGYARRQRGILAAAEGAGKA